MTQLLIDIGNTRIKWGVYESDELIRTEALVHFRLEPNELIAAWQAISTPWRVAISCVGSKPMLELAQAVVKSLWPKSEIVLARSQAFAFGVRNAYREPEKLGVDRWLALIAARRHYLGSVCIVDCGTAMTVDLMDGSGQHFGGYISPGLTLMRKSLAHETEDLAFSDVRYSLSAANHTAAAIYSGTLNAALGFIERVLSAYQRPATLILTGGDAEQLAGQLAGPFIIDTALVLQGLAILLADYK
jgi:type III pantothenate kinase